MLGLRVVGVEHREEEGQGWLQICSGQFVQPMVGL